MSTKFSQFPSGGTIGVGAKIAGLDASVSPDNRIFDFPGLGILDTNGSVLLGWSQPLSGSAVNYLEFQNALTGNPAVISAIGGDANVGLYLTTQNDGDISLVPGGNGFTIIAGSTALGLPSGTTAQRPIGSGGYTRYNSDTGTLEYYDALGNVWTTLSAGGTVASVVGTPNRITSTGGVNPQIDIDIAYIGQTSIQNLGVVTVGTWQADIIQPDFGGTGLSSVTAYSVICGGVTGTSPFQVVSSLGAAGEVLTSNGAGALPTWQAGGGGGSVMSVLGTLNRITSSGGANPIIDIAATYVGQTSITDLGTITTGLWNATAVTVPFGGTGGTSFTAYSLICAGTTGTASFQNVLGLGVSGQVLTSSGAGALPTWTSVAGGTVSSVSGTAGEIVVVNGTTTPTVSIDPTYAGQTSITTLGTISSGTWNGSVVDAQYGGTGVNNSGKNITLGGSLTTVGAFSSVFTMTAATSVIFPTTGTLATTAGTVSSVSGTTNRITSTGGTTPIIDIAATYIGQTSITTLGTVVTGTWNGSLVDVAHGGTGDNNFTAYGVVCGGTTSTGPLQSVSSTGTAGQVLTSAGASALPVWANPATGSVTSVTGTANRITSTGGTTPVIDISAAYTGQSSITTVGTIGTGVWNGTSVDVAHGGTGNTTFTAYTLLCAGTTATGIFQNVINVGTSGQVLTSNGAGALPTWTSVAGGTVTSVSGTVNRITSTGGATPVIDISASYVGQSSITTLGTVGTGVWQGTIVSPTFGGTGVNNGSNTLTLAGNLATSGAFASTFTMTGATSVTFPTSGTLITSAALANYAVLNATNSFGFNEQFQMKLQDYSETVNALGNISGATTLDLTTGNVFTATATGTVTFSVTNVPVSGTAANITLLATNFGAFTINWPAGTVWTNGSTPTLAASGPSTVVMYTVDGGSTWYASLIGLAGSGGTVTSVTGTVNRISVATGTTTPVIDIDAAYVGQTSITTLGTVTTGTWNASVVAGQYGGTGVANTGKTITLGGNLTTSGAFASTFTMTAATNVTFPTSGTLSTTTGTVTSVASGTGITGGPITSTGTLAVVINDMCTGRLTLTTNVPVTTGDILAATTIYWTPYKGNYITLYTGGVWKLYTFTQVSLAVPATTNTVYDIFLFDNSGTLTLFSVAWATDTTRTTGLAFQDGVYVLSGSPQYRYLGSFRTTGASGQTEDSKLKRYLYNYYNRIDRPMSVTETTASWTYTTAAFRQANASTANQVEFVCGVIEDRLIAQVNAAASTSSANRILSAGIGLSSTTVNSATVFGGQVQATIFPVLATYGGTSYSIGRNFITWLEFSNGTGTTTWYGTGIGLTGFNSGTGLTASMFM